MAVDSWYFSYLKVPTINGKKPLKFAVRSWNSWPNLLYKEPRKGTHSQDIIHKLCFLLLILKILQEHFLKPDNKQSVCVGQAD